MTEIAISAVSGTYNRLADLKRMVASVRESAGDLGHEIVLVDGGSTDGTLEWCRKQQDVVLIEQGKLVGAVKAFNEGCRVAQGDYVAILNDDIVVEGDTLRRAYEVLEEQPEIGQIAFRNNLPPDLRPEWRKYRRPLATAHQYLYAQCCLIRRWLGEQAGWWGTGYYTYGGDTHLSMKVWEMGYRVAAVNGCSIYDDMKDDELRKYRDSLGRNQQDADLFNWRWGNRLPAPTLHILAPVPRVLAKASQGCLRTMRFMMPMYGSGELRGSEPRAWEQFGPVMVVNQTAEMNTRGREDFQLWVAARAREFQPDLVILQDHDGAAVLPGTVSRIRESLPHTIIVNYNGDYREEYGEPQYALARTVDLQIVSSVELMEQFRHHGAQVVAWQLNAAEDEFLGVQRDPRGAVVFLGAPHQHQMFADHGLRLAALTALRDAGIPLEVHGSGWDKLGFPGSPQTPDDAAFNARVYARATLALSISATHTATGYTSDRLFFAMGAGCPTLVRQFSGMEMLGLRDGVNVITWGTPGELVEKARYYLAHHQEREEIGAAARGLILHRHTFTHRARSLLAMISDLTPIQGGQ